MRNYFRAKLCAFSHNAIYDEGDCWLDRSYSEE
jgi:hypothetical protein